jgi:hypothetical protein
MTENNYQSQVSTLGTALQMELAVLAEREDKVSRTRLDLVKEYKNHAEQLHAEVEDDDLLTEEESADLQEDLELFVEISQNALYNVADLEIVEDREEDDE